MSLPISGNSDFIVVIVEVQRIYLISNNQIIFTLMNLASPYCILVVMILRNLIDSNFCLKFGVLFDLILFKLSQSQANLEHCGLIGANESYNLFIYEVALSLSYSVNFPVTVEAKKIYSQTNFFLNYNTSTPGQVRTNNCLIVPMNCQYIQFLVLAFFCLIVEPL